MRVTDLSRGKKGRKPRILVQEKRKTASVRSHLRQLLVSDSQFRVAV